VSGEYPSKEFAAAKDVRTHEISSLDIISRKRSPFSRSGRIQQAIKGGARTMTFDELDPILLPLLATSDFSLRATQ
jgi:hypothetical protein